MIVDPKITSLETKVAELEKQLKALKEAIQVDPAGNVEIKTKSGAKIAMTGPMVSINNGALEVL